MALTTRPLVLTCAPLKNITPDWFTSTTWPFASMRPAIREGSGPTTRFSVMALADGCRKSTRCWLPTSKLCQFTAARWVDWLIVVVFAVWPMAAEPATTTPPVGRAFGAGWASAGSDSTSIAVACSAVLTIRAERLRRTTPSSFTLSARRQLVMTTPVTGKFSAPAVLF